MGPELSTLLTLWDESRFLGLLPWREKELSMWKEQHDAGKTPLEVASAELPELSAEALVEIVTGARDDDRQKLKSEDNLQMEGKKLQKQMEPVALPTMSTYTDALNKFTKNATEFIEHLPLLSEARDAYVQAMKAKQGTPSRFGFWRSEASDSNDPNGKNWPTLTSSNLRLRKKTGSFQDRTDQSY